MNAANKTIRRMLKDAKLKQWEVADEAGISAVTFTVWMRKPLEPEQKERVLEAIKRLKAKRKAL